MMRRVLIRPLPELAAAIHEALAARLTVDGKQVGGLARAGFVVKLTIELLAPDALLRALMGELSVCVGPRGQLVPLGLDVIAIVRRLALNVVERELGVEWVGKAWARGLPAAPRC